MKAIFLYILCFLPGMLAYGQEVQWACRVNETNDKAVHVWNTKGILGVPNVYPRLKIGNSWSIGHITDAEEMKGEVFVKLNFCKSIPAKQIVIVENLNPGAIKAVYIYDIKGSVKMIYQAQPAPDTARHRVLSIKFEPMESDVQYVKIVAEPSLVPGANCIDAVGISPSLEPINPAINVYKDAKFLPTVQFMDNNINSIYDEYSPVISPDGKTLYFARLGDPANLGGELEGGDIDIWYSTKDEHDKWLPAQNLGPPLNNKDHNFVASVAAHGHVLLLGNTYNVNGKPQGEGCATSLKIFNKWSSPKNLLLKDFYNNHEHVSFFMANNEKVLLMTIEDTDQSFGEQDIYVSFLKADGTWSSPLNMGPDINTVNSEINIYLSPDMNTLYFSSNGYTGYGGYDIYMSKRLDDTWLHWSKPVNMGPIVNTEEDEYCFVITDDGKYAYGYKYVNSQDQHDIYVIGLPKEVNKVKHDPVLLVTGHVFRAESKQPVAAKVTFTNHINGKETGSAPADVVTGTYEMKLSKGVSYAISINAAGFLPVSENIEATSDSGYVEIKKDIYLTPIEIGRMIKLKNVFFQKGLPDLIETSTPELDKIYQFLKDNPTVVVQLEGHTDNQGDPKGNLILSEKRVKLVKEYLVGFGISSKRILIKAFGGTKPIASNSQEETRKFNRRVEVVIVEK